MKLRDLVSRIDIDPRKLINYALDPENPVGAHKALIFQQQLGYTQDNYALLLKQIWIRLQRRWCCQLSGMNMDKDIN